MVYGDSWCLVISMTEYLHYLDYEDGKFFKGRGVGEWPSEAIGCERGVVWCGVVR